MWFTLPSWLVKFFLDKDKIKTRTLDEFLSPYELDDLRDTFQNPPYINEHFDGLPRRDVINTLVLHCTADDDMPNADVYRLAEYDISPECHINIGVGCPCITYHYHIELVNGNCVVHWCLDHDVKAWHVGPYWNASALAVSIDYNAISLLPQAKWDAAAKIMAWLCKELGLPVSSVVFHRELEHTGWIRGAHGEKILRKTCPGANLDPNKFRKDVAAHLASL